MKLYMNPKVCICMFLTAKETSFFSNYLKTKNKIRDSFNTLFDKADD